MQFRLIGRAVDAGSDDVTPGTEFRQRFGEFLHGAAFGRYEYELRRQTAELNDLFLLLCFMEATALPNPATLYLLEVYPYLLEQFHLWHRRMGIEHSPIGSLPCC